MMENALETRRRTIVKTLLWRITGIAWEWISAYIVIVFVATKYASAAVIATSIVIFYQSTRTVMYYGYERGWVNTEWGRGGYTEGKIPLRTKIAWIVGVTLTTVAIFYVFIFYPS